MKKIFLFLAILMITSSFSTNQKVWVAIGDSITYLNDHAKETGNRVTKGYMTLVVEKLHGIKYINQGHNGWTAGDIAKEIESLGLSKADVYSVFLGTNDWWFGRPVGTIDNYKNNAGNETFFGSYRIIINKLRSLSKNARIILVAPMQRVNFVSSNDKKNNAWGSYKDKNGQSLEQFANAIVSIAQLEKLEVIDLYHNKQLKIENLVHFERLKNPETGQYKDYKYPDFANIPFNPETDEYPYPAEAINLTYDGLHPSDKGNEIIANIFIEKLKK
ncbi:lipolytic enzyme, G-D-S-L [Aquipluma nitroreducens]|uniref:Lipolytic enzyme, G-D-S-L n=1 Tax=Aquipluma nitroreducens TaxID=2010828 RepID=A0A5K7SF31_9BACT|nr:SGNH/GDSL hydrolase family protein [Aquipluma nitroreducens]BBE20242.1 lipolytic enzyme, G-D-S-L [Aquipluma nitroreducens]